MTFNNIKKDRGFTIVELLIVIVVIAILAAITIVAYNGIQNRAKTAAGQSLANSIIKKAEAWNGIKSVYPTNAQLVAGDAAVPEAKLDNTATIKTAVPANTDGGNLVTFLGACTGGGAKVGYWDYTLGTPAAVYIYAGGATSASAGCA
ncbi:MAG: type II secretion system protein [Candidatus Saccharimonadaceae bacterium]